MKRIVAKLVPAIGRGLRWARRPPHFLALLATATLPPALLAKFFSFSPSLGDALLDAAVDAVNPGTLTATQHSVVGGIAALLVAGDIVVAFVLLLFSVLFPAAKLALLWLLLLQKGPRSTKLTQALKTLGPWSMADVFVASVMLLAFKRFPGDTSFEVGWGYYFFLCSVLSGLLATWRA